MLMIRLQRVGRKNDPSFRVVLTDSRNSTKSGKFLEVLGSYDARQGKPQLEGEKIKAWMAKGAQISDTMNNLLIGAKIIEGKKINVLPKRKIDPNAAKAEEAKAETVATPAEEAPAPEVVTTPVEEPTVAETVAVPEPEVVAPVVEETKEEVATEEAPAA